MFCKQCGAAIDDDSNFCRHCGGPQIVDVMRAPPQSETPPAPSPASPDSGGQPNLSGGDSDKVVIWSVLIIAIVAFFVIIISLSTNEASHAVTENPGDAAANALDAAGENLEDMADNISDAAAKTALDATAVKHSDTWSYSTDQDKVRGGITYFARNTSTNSISQAPPYSGGTTMTMVVREGPAYGTDVLLEISSGQMMCPSYEGCSGTVRFDNGPAQHIRFNGPADSSSDTIFVVGAKTFIAKLKRARHVVIEKTLYEAGNPQFEFDVAGLRWDH